MEIEEERGRDGMDRRMAFRRVENASKVESMSQNDEKITGNALPMVDCVGKLPRWDWESGGES